MTETAPSDSKIPPQSSRDFRALRRVFAFTRPYRLRLAGALLSMNNFLQCSTCAASKNG